METQILEAQIPSGRHDGPNLESKSSGIHWGAILGGAAAAAALSLILVPLGTALGFSSFSVFDASSRSLVTFGAGWAIWLVIMQWASSGIGGYVAGRLRVKWADLHSDEVFFRDTVHGFLAWATATLFTLGLAAAVAMGTAGAGGNYYADSLYRGATVPSADAVAETSRILAHDAQSGVTTEDRAYIARQVAARTGQSQADAQSRVDMVLADMEKARKAMVGFSTVLFISLLLGAFIASVSAALGGRLRDQF